MGEPTNVPDIPFRDAYGDYNLESVSRPAPSQDELPDAPSGTVAQPVRERR